MTGKAKKPFIPAARHATIRHEIAALITEQGRSAREISEEVRISEKEVLEHLEHIRTALHRSGGRFLMTPPVCQKCGFQFRKRERLGKPGKCPSCQGEQISPSRFSIAD